MAMSQRTEKRGFLAAVVLRQTAIWQIGGSTAQYCYKLR